MIAAAKACAHHVRYACSPPSALVLLDTSNLATSLHCNGTTKLVCSYLKCLHMVAVRRSAAGTHRTPQAAV